MMPGSWMLGERPTGSKGMELYGSSILPLLLPSGMAISFSYLYLLLLVPVKQGGDYCVMLTAPKDVYDRSQHCFLEEDRLDEWT